MVKSDGMVRTMRRIAMRNNRSRAMSEKAKVIEPTSQHCPQIVEGVRNYVHVINKTLAWYNAVLEIPEDCTVCALKKKIGGKLGYHVNQICLIHNLTNRVIKYNSRKISDYRIADGTLIDFMCQFHTLKGIMTNEFDVYYEIDYV
jgi:hypothetical protein